MLSREQLRKYHDDGYLLLESLVPPDLLSELNGVVDEFVELSRDSGKSDKRFDVEPDHTPEHPRLRRLISPVDAHESFRHFMLEGLAAEIAMAILGNPVRYHHSKLNFKWSDGGEEVKWHQDIQFWPHTDFSPLTIGVYLSDVDDDMGPMGVLPGSHKGELYDLYSVDGSWVGAINDQDVNKLPLEDVIWLKGPAGSVTVHNCCMVHGSYPNDSPRVRPLLLQTYSAVDSYPVKGLGANGVLGPSGGCVIGDDSPQLLTVDGRTMHAAPDWSEAPTIFGSQQKEKKASRSSITGTGRNQQYPL